MSRGRPETRLTKEDIIDATKLVLVEYGKVIQSKIADKLNVTYPTFLKEKKRLGLDPKRIELTERNKAFEKIDWSEEEFIELMGEIDGRTEKTVGYNEFSYKFKESIIFLPIGDLHIGAETTEHSRIAKLITKVRPLSNVFIVFTGDSIDNFGKFSVGGGIHEQAVNVTKQKQIAEWICKYLGDKLLGVIQGCHEEFSYRADGFDFGKYLANISDTRYLGKKALLTLLVGENEYKVYVDHNSRWSSTDNMCHGLKKTCRNQTPFDLGIGAHRHVPNAENSLIQGRMVKTCKISSFKRPDRFIEKVKVPEAPILSQCYVLLAEKVDPVSLGIIYFEKIDYAIRFL